MSDFQIEELKNKINQSNGLLEEIKSLYKTLTENSSIKEIDNQLFEINKAITNLQK